MTSGRRSSFARYFESVVVASVLRRVELFEQADLAEVQGPSAPRSCSATFGQFRRVATLLSEGSNPTPQSDDDPPWRCPL